MELEIRAARLDDLQQLERSCWPREEDEMSQRIADDGSCSILGLDDGRPVAQLYLRAYRPGYRSPEGLRTGEFWADLNGVEDQVVLPERTALLGCWHVGRVRDADGTERAAEKYRGQGIGIALARGAIDWLNQPETPFEALAVKAPTSDDRSFLGFVGVLSRSMLESVGFRSVADYEDPYFAREHDFLPEEVRVENFSRFHLMLCERDA